ncbi:hypothetical protein BC629DRAFT_1438618 [Irpex lacteus]|nr:hypothetical protein BC629DRAFT_1438618 [Irpex lacteus]
MSAEEPVRLIFDPSTKVAGQVIEGAVDLHWPTAVDKNIEEVVLKLRGEINTQLEHTRIHNVGGHTRSHRETEYGYTNLIKQDIVLWEPKTGGGPPPNTPVFRLPFRIQLPEDLPPSCDIGDYSTKGTVGYYLEAVGKRSGLHFNKKHLVPFPVLPSSSLGAQLKDVLEQGWHGRWKSVDKEDKLNRGFMGMGEHAHAKVSLALPDIEVLPMHASIPIAVNIVTLSKHMHLDDTPDDEPIFPVPPTKSGEVELVLKRNMRVEASAYSDTMEGEHVQVLGGLGEDLPLDQYSHIQIRPFEKQWIPSEKDKGQWRQEATITSWFRLTCPPTFNASPAMNIDYSLRLKVDFPGVGNDVKLDFPVRVASSVSAQNHTGWGNMPVPQLDLPPSYFEQNKWNSDK